MKKLMIIIMLLFAASVIIPQKSFAQGAQDKIEAARIAMITERLNLSPEEAQKFWPLYNEFSSERKLLQQEYLQARQDFRKSEMTEEESERLLKLGYQLKERELDLERKYAERLNTVITNRQLIALRKAEEDFRKILLERLQERRERQQNFQNRQDRKFRDN
jgi:hypothetical protein